MTEETVQIGFRGTREYRKKIKQATLDHNFGNVQEFLEAAVEHYLNAGSTPKVVPMLGVPHGLQSVVDAFVAWWTKPKTPLEKPTQKFIAETIGVLYANGEKGTKTNGA